MATEVKLPRLGQGMESGTIVKWLKGEGEPVKKREPLYELDTDKVTQEVEAEADGVLLKIVVDAGEVEVGRTIAFIGEEGEEVPASGNGAAPPAEAEAESDEAAVEEQDEPQTEGASAPGMDDQRAAGQEAAAATAAAEQPATSRAVSPRRGRHPSSSSLSPST
jgi:pyruvate dehydrogenase E2 component (dihydrolipoamide acetyltransferase)